MKREIEFYDLHIKYGQGVIRYVSVTVTENDIVTKGRNSFIEIELKDAYTNYHNGNGEDRFISGYIDFKEAKKALIKEIEKDAKKEIARLKKLTIKDTRNTYV